MRGDQNDFSFSSAPICRAEIIQRRENDQLPARIPSPCKFRLFICLPSVDYLWRRNSVCGAWGGEAHSSVIAFRQKSSTFAHSVI